MRSRRQCHTATEFFERSRGPHPFHLDPAQPHDRVAIPQHSWLAAAVFCWFTAVAIAATPMFGVEWRPLSRADLTWVEDAGTSGVQVGEFDGTVNPALLAYGGAWFGPRFGLTGTLGIARLGNLTTADEITTSRSWMVVRPGVDVRVGLQRRALHLPIPYAIAGIHLSIPAVGDKSEGYTKAEQEAVTDALLVETARLAGAGARGGLGVDYRLTNNVAVGLNYTVEWHRAFWQADDVAFTTSWLQGVAALTLQFEWPRVAPAPPPAA